MGTWAIWAALQVAGLYTHYFYVFALAFQILWLWRATRDDRRARIALIGACAATAAAAACWAPMWLRQQAFLANIGHGSLSGLWRPLTLIERLWKLGAELVSPKSVWIQLWVSAIVLASGAFACWGRLRKQPLAQILQNTPAWLRFSALWLACVVGGLLAVDLISNTHRIFPAVI